jgi:hypothetical protein
MLAFSREPVSNETPSVVLWRKRRGSDTQIRHEYGRIAFSPTMRHYLMPPEVLSGEYPLTKLTPDTVATVRKLTREGASLRAIAAMVGVSHETVRNVLRAAS